MTVPLHCSFCGKSQHEVRKLIAGPSTYICDECVGLCNEIIDAEGSAFISSRRTPPGTFQLLGRLLDQHRARRRSERSGAQPASADMLDRAVQGERERCASIVEGEADRLQRIAGHLLGWSVTQGKLRVLRHMADLIRNPSTAAMERQQ